MSVSAAIRAVLEAHPLKAGEGFYAGHVVCTGCDLVVDPTEHLVGVVAEALDGPHTPLEAPGTAVRPDPRESYANWGAAS